MVRKLPPYVVKEYTRHGKLIFYFRKDGGSRTRLPYPNEPNFMPAYLSALSGVPIEQGYIKPQKKEPQTLRWLVSQYRKSSHWASLRLNTRKLMDHYLEKAIQNSGNVDYKKITSKHIRNALDERKNKLGATLNFFRAMQSLFKWATSNEYVAVNPCSGVDKPKNKSEGFKPWTKEDMIQFRDYWKEGSIPRLAFEFLFFTGLRSSDACRAGYQHLKGNVFSIQTQKVGTIVTTELPDIIIKLLEITPTGRETFIVNRDKEKMHAQQFSLWFSNKARQAGIKKSAHGVRKLSATVSAESGATAHELMAVYGWKSISQAEVYTKGADRIELGKKASRRMAFSVNNPEPKK
ncbi:MAG: tyrosine-type recombinase/integrase [Candidatus Liberibacter solanacearum]|uniref:site-specific integrase n=1 Tax=Candidatus Liberibacter solanacearum TaxID=556287 RepID=UPI000978F6B3|nr:tyrosine-type recombinase/integrase [Candidatus Liberibacter solanacearum]ONI58491.1 integrase [Candidatus Liberibacter solanacearum]